MTLSWTYKHSRTPEASHKVVDLLDRDYDFDMSTDREISSFRIEMVSKMGLKRLAGKGGFIDSVVDLFESFYGSVVESLQTWQPPAPKLPEPSREGVVAHQPLISQTPDDGGEWK